MAKNSFSFGWILGLLFLTVISASPALSAEFHVTTAAEFQAALDSAETNGEDDTIDLKSGTYQGNFRYDSEDGKSLTIQGESGTTPQDIILDGGSAGKVLYLLGSSGGGRVTIEGVTIQNGSESGLYVSFQNESLDITLNNAVIQNNSNWDRGGGIYLRPRSNATIRIEVRNSIIRNNQSQGSEERRQGRGGGIWAFSCNGNSSVDLLIVNSLIYMNQANWTGGGIEVAACELGDDNVARVTVINSTITNNVSNQNSYGFYPGGGISVESYPGNGTIASADLYNTIVYGNTYLDGDDGHDLYTHQESPGITTVNAHSCVIQHVISGTGTYFPENVIDTDPVFVDPVNDLYYLSGDSPCINAGTNSVPSPPGLPSTDLEGYPRVIGTAPDIGAYEWTPVRPGEGTVGTEIIVSQSGIGTKKGKVLMGSVPLKIVKWTTGAIRGQLTRALSPGTYVVTVQSKGVDPIVIDNGFTVKAPEIDSVEPTHGSTGDETTVNGLFFGTKKGKVRLGGKNCKVLNWTMGSATGEGEIRFVVPKGLSPGTHELKITNGVESDATNFTVE